jgi:hypothetical protein
MVGDEYIFFVRRWLRLLVDGAVVVGSLVGSKVGAKNKVTNEVPDAQTTLRKFEVRTISHKIVFFIQMFPFIWSTQKSGKMNNLVLIPIY